MQLGTSLLWVCILFHNIFMLNKMYVFFFGGGSEGGVGGSRATQSAATIPLVCPSVSLCRKYLIDLITRLESHCLGGGDLRLRIQFVQATSLIIRPRPKYRCSLYSPYSLQFHNTLHNYPQEGSGVRATLLLPISRSLSLLST